jgi:hypothetical protein
MELLAWKRMIYGSADIRQANLPTRRDPRFDMNALCLHAG